MIKMNRANLNIVIRLPKGNSDTGEGGKKSCIMHHSTECEFSDGRWYPRTLAEWFGCRIDISPSKMWKLFAKYCASTTPNPELLSLFLTHRLLSSNRDRRKGTTYGDKFKGKRNGQRDDMDSTLPQIQVRLSAPEVSTGEELIDRAHQLVTIQ